MSGHTENTTDFMLARVDAMQKKLISIKSLLNDHEQGHITNAEFVFELRILMLNI